MLGELAALATLFESSVDAQEVRAVIDDLGVVWPAKPPLYSAMSLQGELNSRMVDMVRELAGGSMIMLPASVADANSVHSAADLRRYISSPKVSFEERTALMKLAWDIVGTEFASRHLQYEKFYGGASHLVKMNMFRAYDFDRALRSVELAILGSGVKESVASIKQEA